MSNKFIGRDGDGEDITDIFDDEVSKKSETHDSLFKGYGPRDGLKGNSLDESDLKGIPQNTSSKGISYSALRSIDESEYETNNSRKRRFSSNPKGSYFSRHSKY